MLAVRDLHAGYGPIEVIKGVGLSVEAGEIVALIGWVGSGKTTLMRTIAGLLSASAGEVNFEGRDVTALPAHQRVALGITMVPEGRRLFPGMTVGENILVGAHLKPQRAAARRMDFVFELFPILKERVDQIAGTLSGGEQQMCAIARALMAEPSLLLVDELSLGLAPFVVERLAQVLITVRELGTAIILVEQDAELALSISSRAYVLRTGRIVRAGSSAEIRDDPQVVRDYFRPLDTLVAVASP